MARIEPQRLLRARWLRECTQAELVRLTGVSQTRISRLEHGILDLSPLEEDQVGQSIERALDLPIGFLKGTGDELSLPDHFYRKRATASKRDQRWIEAVIASGREGINHLCGLVEFEAPFEVPYLSTKVGADGVPQHDPVEVAKLVRRELMIPDGPIRDLTAVIESTNTILVPIHDAPEKFDAVAFPALRGGPNMIFYNAQMPGDRARFTLAHEFGHLVMHRHAAPECEDEANAFASEFLMPGAQIRGQLRGINLQLACDLKRIWGVSIQSLIVRAKTLGCITQSRFKSLYVMLSKKGWRKSEPVDVAMSPPQLFDELVTAHRRVGYSTSEVARLFGCNADEFSRRFTANKFGTLSIV